MVEAVGQVSCKSYMRLGKTPGSKPSDHLKFTMSSGKKDEPRPKRFGPDILGWGGGLPREGVGGKKFGMSFETQGNQTLCGISRDFCRDIPGVPEK